MNGCYRRGYRYFVVSHRTSRKLSSRTLNGCVLSGKILSGSVFSCKTLSGGAYSDRTLSGGCMSPRHDSDGFLPDAALPQCHVKD